MTMSAIIKMTTLPLSASIAFNKFQKELQIWWPKQYTWSKEKLVILKIEDKVNGHCSEIGPDDFRCDWGRVLEIEKGKRIKFLWQIDHDRVPQPNPDKASEVEITFEDINEKNCTLKLVHRYFERHDVKQHLYFETMNGQHGWDYILSCFTDYCNH